MINRNVLRCRTCDQRFVGRFGVGSGRLPFIFECPHCGVVLRASMEPNAATLDLNWASDDVEVEDYDQVSDVEALTSITVYADLPVPKDLQGVTAQEAIASPFLVLSSLVGLEQTAALMERIEALRHLRSAVLPGLRRASAHVASGDFDRLTAAIPELPDANLASELSAFHPAYAYARFLDLMYLPFAPLEPRLAAVSELGTLLVAAEQLDDESGSAHLEGLVAGPEWTEHRRQVVETTMAALDEAEALMPALVWEQVPSGAASVDDFQVMRNDFDRLKGIYQDIFELSSRTLAYLGVVLNLVHRGEAEAWVDGKRWSLSKALQVRAVDREPILAELPKAKRLYTGIDRHTRNQIGHRLVAFDFATQTLIDSDGRRANYLLFLLDFLAAARLTSYLFAVVEKMTVHALRGRVPQREEAGLPIRGHAT